MTAPEPDSAPLSEETASTPRKDRSRRRRRIRRVLLIVLAVLVIVTGGLVTTAYVLTDHLAGNVARVPNVFAHLDPAQRPADVDSAQGAETILLVGTDSRSTAPTTGTNASAPDFVYGAQRSDVIMLVRLDPGFTHAQVVSIPRDSWAPIPGHGTSKINAAYSWGGPRLLIQTVEELTKVRIDHVAVIDFSGFAAMTDAVGGIDVNVSVPTSTWGTVFHAGVNHLDGEQALNYVRQRDGLPGGDLGREQREQAALRALLDKGASLRSVGNLGSIYSFLDAFTKSVSIDDTMTNQDLQHLALSLTSLHTGNIVFMSAPVASLGMEGSQSVVHLDPTRSAELWTELDNCDVTHYVAANPSSVLGQSTR
jgi:LCP family protein required for cell wall assembly